MRKYIYALLLFLICQSGCLQAATSAQRTEFSVSEVIPYNSLTDLQGLIETLEKQGINANEILIVFKFYEVLGHKIATEIKYYRNGAWISRTTHLEFVDAHGIAKYGSITEGFLRDFKGLDNDYFHPSVADKFEYFQQYRDSDSYNLTKDNITRRIEVLEKKTPEFIQALKKDKGVTIKVSSRPPYEHAHENVLRAFGMSEEDFLHSKRQTLAQGVMDLLEKVDKPKQKKAVIFVGGVSKEQKEFAAEMREQERTLMNGRSQMHIFPVHYTYFETLLTENKEQFLKEFMIAYRFATRNTNLSEARAAYNIPLVKAIDDLEAFHTRRTAPALPAPPAPMPSLPVPVKTSAPTTVSTVPLKPAAVSPVPSLDDARAPETLQ